MIPLLILVTLAALPYALYRAARRWGSDLWFFAAGVSFLGAAGVLAEHWWGPRWSWNFAHHDRGYAEAALIQGIVFVALGIWGRRSRQRDRS